MYALCHGRPALVFEVVTEHGIRRMRPWAELTELVEREEARLSIAPADDPAPSARLLAIISSLRAIAAHEAARAEAATLAQARAELERDRIAADAERANAALDLAERDRRAVLYALSQLLRTLESKKRRTRVRRLSKSPIQVA